MEYIILIEHILSIPLLNDNNNNLIGYFGKLCNYIHICSRNDTCKHDVPCHQLKNNKHLCSCHIGMYTGEFCEKELGQFYVITILILGESNLIRTL